MTAVTVLHAVGLAVTANSTTWVTVATLAAANFVTGRDYIIKATLNVRMNGNTNDMRVRLAHGPTPTLFTDTNLSYEVGLDVQETNIGFLQRFTQPGTTEDVLIQISTSATNIVTCEVGTVTAMDLTNLVENTDYWWNEVTANYTTTTTPTAQAAVTLTANGNDSFAIWGNGVFDVLTVTDEMFMEIHDSVAGVLVALAIEGEDATNDIRSHLAMTCVVPSAASHTFSTRFAHETDADTVLRSAIFVLRLNAFRQFAFQRTAGQATPAASPTWTNIATASITLDPTGPASVPTLVWGYNTNDVNNTGDDGATRFQIDRDGGGLVNNPNYTNSSPAVDNWDATDLMPNNLATVADFTTGGSRVANLDMTMIAGTAWRAQERTILVLPLELLGFPPVPRQPKQNVLLRR